MKKSNSRRHTPAASARCLGDAGFPIGRKLRGAQSLSSALDN
jgi:hypothetical protein